MRNVFAISLFVFIVICAGGYGISWYAQAASTKRYIEATIAKINEKQPYITYEAIESSGFPSNVYVSIVRPHFKGRIDELAKVFKDPSQPAPAPMQEWTEDALLNGRITFGINALSDQYSLAISGNWTDTATIGGKTTTTDHQQLSDLNCMIQLRRSSGMFDTLWNFSTLNRDAKALAADFRMLDCNNVGQKALDTTTQEVLSSIGLTRIYITNNPQKDNSQIRFYVKATDAEITTAGQARITAMMNALSPASPFTSNLASYGKQNMDIDFTYYGPPNFDTANKNPTVDFALNKLNLSNQIYDYKMSFHLYNAPAGEGRSSTVSLKSETTFSEKQDELIKASAREMISQFSTIKDPNYPQTQEFFKKHTPEQAYDIAYSILPNFSSLGKIVLAVDGNFKGSTDMTSGDYVVDTLEMSATPYGITGKGNLKMVATNLPSGTLQLSCANCLLMIDDMASYNNRIQKFLSYVNPEKYGSATTSYSITPDQLNAVKQFMTLLSAQQDPNDKTTLAYIINGSGLNVTVNNKSMADIIKIYNEYVRPTLKASAH